MRGLMLGVGVVEIALGLFWLLVWFSDQRREPPKRMIRPPHLRPVWAVAGVVFLVSGPLWILRGLGG